MDLRSVSKHYTYITKNKTMPTKLKDIPRAMGNYTWTSLTDRQSSRSNAPTSRGFIPKSYANTRPHRVFPPAIWL